jgi:DNA-binding response OmpR family regulator
MSPPDAIRVHVLAEDLRLREAARALPNPFEASFSVSRGEALEAVKSGAEIAIIDLDCGGFGVSRDIRDTVRGREVRILMICSRPEDRWLCRQAGADDVLVKPILDPSVLTNATQRLMHGIDRAKSQ